VEGRRLEVQKATLDMAGANRLQEIRASMTPELGGGGGRPAVAENDTAAVSATSADGAPADREPAGAEPAHGEPAYGEPAREREGA
jgi:hypothetical protein